MVVVTGGVVLSGLGMSRPMLGSASLKAVHAQSISRSGVAWPSVVPVAPPDPERSGVSPEVCDEVMRGYGERSEA